ncbi:energy transducer TonB [Spirulina subsalsa]|uniref:energy transducer TonB n=1 Tax=Spirulina subsalsa TaxID=54311 RepID=UPI000A021221|nr:TonB family protein [Spirulina subsalsa]
MWVTRLSYDLHRDGRVSNIQVLESSGFAPLDQSAIAHVQTLQRQFRPFPECYTRDTMNITHRFQLRYN